MLLGLPCLTAAGQSADSLGGPVPDFTTDSLAVAIPEPQLLARGPLGDRPARRPELDLPSLLSSLGGAWTYDFGAHGWPDGWSLYGLDPGSGALVLDEMPFDDPVTSRPDYGILPFDKLDRVSSPSLSLAAAQGLSAEIASFASSRPVTELVYRSTNTGLQSVSVVHAQTRASGSAGRIQYLFGYQGAGARGEYDGSKLSRKRQTLLRVRRETPRLRVEIGEMFNRHRVGAHGGVQQLAGFAYESIYQRLGATVEDASAVRQTSRNDLWIAAEMPESKLTARAWWTVSTLTYRITGDTTVARVSRLGARVAKGLPRDITASMRVQGDFYPTRNAWSPETRKEAHATLDGAWSVASAQARWKAGLSALEFGRPDAQADVGWRLFPTGSVDLEWAGRTLQPFARLREGINPPSAADLFGYGESYEAFTEAAIVGRQGVYEIGGRSRRGWLSLETRLAVTRSRDGLARMLDAAADTVRVTSIQATRTRTMGIARLGLRDVETHGLYAWVEATSLVASDVGAAFAGTIPDQFGKVAIGVRGVLFKGDLDGDLSLRARAWTAHRGLRLHTPSGLLALPDGQARPVDGSMVLDIVGIAHVRTATLTVSLENVLSGTTLIPGNQFVPDYPYPERRLRFSVFWPIFD